MRISKHLSVAASAAKPTWATVQPGYGSFVRPIASAASWQVRDHHPSSRRVATCRHSSHSLGGLLGPRGLATSSSSRLRSSVDKVDPNDDANTGPRSSRSLMYVPGSSEKYIRRGHTSDADCIIFDLEDSVAPHRKGAAREAVLHGLNAAPRPGPELAVRINPPSGDRSLAADDLDIVLPSPQLETIVLPKVESVEDVRFVMNHVQSHRHDSSRAISLILSIESAGSLLRMPQIVEEAAKMSEASAKKSRDGTPAATVTALLFASEDYCAATGITRTRSRRELLFPRAQIVTIAKAYGLGAIDMVCIDFKDIAYLNDECQDGLELGFDGKQAIHPSQVAIIQKAYTPSDDAIKRAARIKITYERAISQHRGAASFEEAGSVIMIDAPMLKQADKVLAKARSAGIDVSPEGLGISTEGNEERSDTSSVNASKKNEGSSITPSESKTER